MMRTVAPVFSPLHLCCGIVRKRIKRTQHNVLLYLLEQPLFIRDSLRTAVDKNEAA
jgi:hypothetical protein